ncbi:MAG: hypothetical protein V1820_04455 [archaeon]
MDKKIAYSDFLRLKTIRRLPEIEKENYLKFHSETWKEDLETSELLLGKNERWAVIAGYYAMHNLAKEYIARKFNLKIDGKFVHAAAVSALREFSRRDPLSGELAELLEKAKAGRALSQYYTGKKISSGNATEFLETVVRAFVKKAGRL